MFLDFGLQSFEMVIMKVIRDGCRRGGDQTDEGEGKRRGRVRR